MPEGVRGRKGEIEREKCGGGGGGGRKNNEIPGSTHKSHRMKLVHSYISSAHIMKEVDLGCQVPTILVHGTVLL